MFKRIKQWVATRILRRGGTSQQREEAVGVLQKELALEPLVAALQDKNRAVRKAVAEALGLIGDARTVEPLVAALQNKNQEVREDVGQALVRIGKPAVEPLVAALQDKNRAVRRIAAEVLGQIGDAQAVEPLVAALQDEDITRAGLTALERILTHAAAGIAPKDLYAVTQLDKVVQLRYQYNCDNTYTVLRDSLDCSYVRQLARQELIRRGLPA